MITVEPVQAMTLFLFNIRNKTTCFVPVPDMLYCMTRKARIWSPGLSCSTNTEYISWSRYFLENIGKNIIFQFISEIKHLSETCFGNLRQCRIVLAVLECLDSLSEVTICQQKRKDKQNAMSTVSQVLASVWKVKCFTSLSTSSTKWYFIPNSQTLHSSFHLTGFYPNQLVT